MGWLIGYSYYKQVTLSGTSAGDQTNYQMKLIVGESSTSSGSNVHCENHCQNFPNDVRFTNTDGETKHDYWIEKTEGTTPNRSSTVWVELDSIPTSGVTTFYMYYGKNGESDESDGDNTFDFFTDYNTGEILTFSETQSLSVGYRAWQGVTSDGTYLYTFTNKDGAGDNNAQKIYKFNKSGTQLDVNLAAGTDHMSDGHYYNEKLYVADMKNWSSGQAHTSASGQVKVYNTTSGLPYANEQHDVGGHWAESITYYDEYWWVVFHCCSIIRKYDSSWDFVKEYNIAGHGGTETSWADGNGYQGIVFFQKFENIYVGLTVHGGVTGGTEFYYFKYTNDEFTLVEHLDPPNTAANQGWCTDDSLDISDVWFADRDSSAVRQDSGNFLLKGDWDKYTDRTGGKIEQVDTPQKRSSSNAFKYTQESADTHGMFRDIFTTQSGIFIIEFDVRLPQTNKREYFVISTTSLSWATSDHVGPFLQFDQNGYIQLYTSSWENVQSYNADQWYKIKMLVSLSNDDVDVYVDDILRLSNKSFGYGNTQTALNQINMGGNYDYNGGISFIQDARIRKYVSPEPTWNSWGNETSSGGNIKSITGVLWANIKSINGILRADIKSINGIT